MPTIGRGIGKPVSIGSNKPRSRNTRGRADGVFKKELWQMSFDEFLSARQKRVEKGKMQEVTEEVLKDEWKKSVRTAWNKGKDVSSNVLSEAGISTRYEEEESQREEEAAALEFDDVEEELAHYKEKALPVAIIENYESYPSISGQLKKHEGKTINQIADSVLETGNQMVYHSWADASKRKQALREFDRISEDLFKFIKSEETTLGQSDSEARKMALDKINGERVSKMLKSLIPKSQTFRAIEPVAQGEKGKGREV